MNDVSAKPSTRERLLDISEQMFADKGVEGVSIRSINSAANLSPGILHYHFGNKDTLLEAIVARRMDEIMQSRKVLIEQIEAATDVNASDIATILVRPLANFVLANQQQGHTYVKLIAKLYAERSPILENVNKRYSDIGIAKIPALYAKACPRLSPSQLSLRIGFANHVLLQSACEWLAEARNWQANDSSPDTKISELTEFIAAGLASQ